MTNPPILQICPNDHPPFMDICQIYQAAVESLGHRLVTVFLSRAHAQPMVGAIYLDSPSLRHTGQVAATLASELTPLLGQPSAPAVPLVICHRYRAHRVFRASRISADVCLAIAHEFDFFGRWRRRLDQRLFARRVRFAGVSPPVVDELARAVKQPLLMPNGINLARGEDGWWVDRAEALRFLKLHGEHFNIGVVGRLHPKKQPQLALDGFASLKQALPEAHLLFIGDGELKTPLQERARGLSVGFAGFVPDAARYVRALDVLLIPSGEREAFSMVALEAMAAGVRVVAGPTPGPHFVLGDVGCYFQEFTAESLAGAVQAVYRDRGRDEARSALGVQRAEQEFSVAALARRLQPLLSPTG